MSSQLSKTIDQIWQQKILTSISTFHSYNILDRYGFNSDTTLTLEATGRTISRTRERVRQLEEIWIKALQEDEDFKNSALHRQLLQAISKNLPATEDEVQKSLLTQGLLSKKWALGGIRLVYKLFQKEQLNFNCLDLNDNKLWFNHQFLPTPSQVRSSILQTRPNVSSANAINCAAILETLNSKLEKDQQLTARELSLILQHTKDIVNLDCDSVMFAQPSVKNARFFNASKTTLSITGKLTAENLLEAVARRYQARGHTPPELSTAIKLWSHSEDYITTADNSITVALNKNATVKQLPKAELAVIAECRKLGLATRQQLLSAIPENKFPLASLSTAISFCPVLQAVPGHHGYWRIRSDEAPKLNPTPRKRQRNPHQTKVLAVKENLIDILFNANYQFNGLLYLPGAQALPLRPSKGQANCKFLVKNTLDKYISVSATGASWGYAPFCKEQTQYRLSFNLELKEVTITTL